MSREIEDERNLKKKNSYDSDGKGKNTKNNIQFYLTI